MTRPTPLPYSGSLPYSGHRLDRQRRIGERWSERLGRVEVTAADAANASFVTYDYNELGFRGPSYDPSKRWTAFVFGESDAFGAGVRFEDVWAVRAAREVARRRGLDERDVQVVSFADEGASNAHIARMVVTQCGRVRPDLVLVNFAEESRTEGLANGDVFTAGPWLATDAAKAMADGATEEGGLREQMQERLARGRAYLEFCTKRQGMLDALHEMLLVQNVLAAWRIDAVAIARRTKEIFGRSTTQDPVTGPLVEQLDPAFLPRFRPTRLRWRNDWSEDGQHYGPRTHATIAKRVVAHLERNRPDVLQPPGRVDAPSRRRGAASVPEPQRTSAAILRSRHA